MGGSRSNYVAKSRACREPFLALRSVMLCGMAKRTGAMHVAKVSKKYVTKAGVSRESVAYLLRRTYRDGVTVRHETLANLSALPEATLEAVRVSLTGQSLVVPGRDLEVTRALPHGHVAAVHAQAKALGLPAPVGPAARAPWPGRGPRRRAHAARHGSPPGRGRERPATGRSTRPAPPPALPPATPTSSPVSRA